jgi:hypothetical protein
MKPADLALDRPLLAVGGNAGCRYVITRDRSTGEPWCVSIDADGGMGASPVSGFGMGASTEPFDTWVACGELPEGARRVEVEADGQSHDAKVRAGLWLVAVPWGNRDCEGVVRFIGSDGEPVRDEPLDLIRTRRL